MYDLVTATESDEIKLVLNTRGGSLAMTSADEDLLRLDFTPESLENALDIALKLSPGNTRNAYQNLSKNSRFTHSCCDTPVICFFHILPLKLSVIMTAQ